MALPQAWARAGNAADGHVEHVATPKVINTMSYAIGDIDAATAKAAAAGGTVVVQKRAVPGSGWLTYLRTPPA